MQKNRPGRESGVELGFSKGTVSRNCPWEQMSGGGGLSWIPLKVRFMTTR